MNIALTPDSFEYVYKSFCRNLKKRKLNTPSRSEFKAAFFVLSAGINSNDSKYIADKITDSYLILMNLQ
jgi:hypothetical protein